MNGWQGRLRIWKTLQGEADRIELTFKYIKVEVPGKYHLNGDFQKVVEYNTSRI